MSELQNEINEAFIMISTIPVSGDNAERMAMARAHLRRAYKLADPPEEKADRSEVGSDG